MSEIKTVCFRKDGTKKTYYSKRDASSAEDVPYHKMVGLKNETVIIDDKKFIFGMSEQEKLSKTKMALSERRVDILDEIKSINFLLEKATQKHEKTA